MFELEMFNLMTKANEIQFHDLSIFEFSGLIDKINELIDNNFNIYLIYESLLMI